MTQNYKLDANVIIRFLTNDHHEHSPLAKNIFEKISAKELSVDVHTGIIAECVWVLKGKVYGFSREKIAEALKRVLSFDNINVEDELATMKALTIFGEKGIDFMDAYLIAKSEIDNAPIITFNTKDMKGYNAEFYHPKEILEQEEGN